MYSPIVTEFPGFMRCTIAGQSSTAASLRGRVGGPGGASASKSGSMSAFVPWNMCPLRDSDGGLRLLSYANTLFINFPSRVGCKQELHYL